MNRLAVGQHSIGGQKRRWNNAMMDHLKKCNLLADYRTVAREWTAWRGVVKLSADTLNGKLESPEKEKEDQRKKRREGEQPASSQFACNELGCLFCQQGWHH